MKRAPLPLLVVTAFVGLSANAATIYLDNNFDSNAGNDIGPAFQIVSNNTTTSTANTDPAAGVINFTRTNGNPSVGFSSNASMDLSGEQGFTMTWVVTSATIADIQFNGWFFGVSDTIGTANSGSSLWNNNNAFGVAFNGTEGSKSPFDLVTVAGGTKSYTNLGTEPTNVSLEDGFTVEMTLMSDESWSVTTTGLSTNVTGATGTAAAGTYASIAGSMVATTAWQGRGSTPNIGNYDSVTLVAVPEPGSFALIGGALALTSVMLRRRPS